MKALYKLSLTCIAALFLNALQAQVLVVSVDTTLTYKKSKKNGMTYQGLKVGKWVETSSDGTIYSECNYDNSGNREGTWVKNFPDGNPRRYVEYENNAPIKFTLYRLNRMVAEVLPKTQLSDSLNQRLDLFEINLFEYEKLYFNSWSVGYKGLPYQGMYSYNLNPFEYAENIPRILRYYGFVGQLIIWNNNKTIKTKIEFAEDAENTIDYFYNKRLELSKQKEYKDGVLTKTIIFGKNGEQKIKEK